jgi:ParB family chromosome partitioning protein
MVHPANPRTELGDLADLEASIAEQGLLQPPIVLPADRVAAAWPDHAAAITAAGAAWVVLMGARRRTAAGNIAGDDPNARLPVLIRTDPVCDDPLAQLDAMIAENTARQPLTPLEEARAFTAQVAAGRSQRAIANRAGCSQSHVSKRLKLLRLPGAMQADLETGRVDDEGQPVGRLLIKDALAYVDATGDTGDAGDDALVILAAYKLQAHRPMWKPDQLVREVRREQARRVQHEALTKKAEAEGVPLIADAEKKFGGYYEARQRRLDGHKAIATARKDGTLAATVSDGGLVYYSTAKTKPKKTENRSVAEEQRITDERERRTAMHARADAAALLAARPPKLPAGAADIVDALLSTAANDYLQLAR